MITYRARAHVAVLESGGRVIRRFDARDSRCAVSETGGQVLETRAAGSYSYENV
jgi:hypothetical protein